MLKDLMPQKTQPDNPERTLNVMQYELGFIAHGIVYSSNRKTAKDPDPNVISSHLQEARLNHADLIAQCMLLAEQMEWDWEIQVVDGIDRFRHRMWELREGII